MKTDLRQSTYFRLSLFSIIFFATGCHTDKDIITEVYNGYHYDQQVISKLPMYDSLAAAISAKFPVYRSKMNDDDSYVSFRFMPSSSEESVFKTLPPEAGPDVQRYYHSIGEHFIFGFDVFKDSTIKIYIRKKKAEGKPVDIEENLSYLPKGNIQHREFPAKDTVLQNHWQYWIRFDKEGIF